MRPALTATARVLAPAAMLAAALLSAAGAAADDASNYDGTACTPEQFYDATVQRCLPELVTNDPQGQPQPHDIGANYDGTKCDPGLFYDGSDALCALDAVTNDPRMAETLEKGEPVDSNLPTVGGD